MEIIAISVCHCYDDILKYMLKQNAKFFKMWYIVTSNDDIGTIELIQKSGLTNIEILYFNDFFNESRFNKGGALLFAQNYVYQTYTDANVLILDADIYLPDSFATALPTSLEPMTLYRVKERWDYDNVQDFLESTTNRTHYGHTWLFVEFFQLYKQDERYKYFKSNDCAGCDNDFRELFHLRNVIEVEVKHLGGTCVNWFGRKSTRFD
jgi:hypothetical protein